MTSHYIFEQKKAEELKANLEKMTSHYIFEQKKAEELKANLEKMTSHYIFEQKKAEELKKRLAVIMNEMEKIKNRLIRLEQYPPVRCLIFFQKVRLRVRNGIKRFAYKLGHFVYIKLIPFPKIRLVFSKINARLRIFKDPSLIKEARNSSRFENKSIENSITVKVVPTTAKLISEINVAFLSDEFSYNSFRDECHLLSVSPDNWKDVFENNEIDFFFCESAWTGIDPVKHPWKGQVYCSINFPKENRTKLLEILDYCKTKNIPTVFWNKEDPAFYGDKVHNFVDTAIKFDHIFTTSIECVERYKQDYGHRSVHLLMFATQPRLFNPIENFDRTEDIIFAGSWYWQYPQRSKEMEMIFDKIIENNYNLLIFDRYFYSQDPNHFYPNKYKPYIKPPVPHSEIEIAYKRSKYALNVNTIVDSETMFARRVFELMSSNTLVISNYSKGMDNLFGENVIFVKNKDTIIDLSKHIEQRKYCLNEVLNYHTYRNRLQQILDTIGICYRNPEQQTYFIYEIQNEDDADNSIDHFRRIDWEDKTAVLLVSAESEATQLRKIVVKYNSENIFVLSKHYFKKYAFEFNFDAQFFIWCDLNLQADFPRRAFLHNCYLKPGTGIAESNTNSLYCFRNQEISRNVLYPIDQLPKLEQKLLHGFSPETEIYGI